MKLCAYCGKSFVAQRSTARYCCDGCRNRDRRRKKQEQRVENRRAAAECRKPVDIVARELLDEEVASYFLDLEAATSALIDASTRANPQLRLLCGRVGRRVRDVLFDEGVIE